MPDKLSCGKTCQKENFHLQIHQSPTQSTNFQPKKKKPIILGEEASLARKRKKKIRVFLS